MYPRCTPYVPRLLEVLKWVFSVLQGNSILIKFKQNKSHYYFPSADTAMCTLRIVTTVICPSHHLSITTTCPISPLQRIWRFCFIQFTLPKRPHVNNDHFWAVLGVIVIDCIYQWPMKRTTYTANVLQLLSSLVDQPITHQRQCI